PAALTAAVALGVGMTAALDRAPAAARSWICILGGGAFLIGMAWEVLKVYPMSTAGVPADPDTLRTRIIPATDANEFLPVGVPSRRGAPPRGLVASSAGAEVDIAHSDGSLHLVGARAKAAGATVTLNVNWFPGWHASTVVGPGEARLDADGRGLMRLTLPA